MIPAEWARTLLMGRKPDWVRADLRRQKKAREAHKHALASVVSVLRSKSLLYKIVYRTFQIDMSQHDDLVISVGGDGTFLEAARVARRQLVLGVNSDPERSVGSFCSADAESFERVLDRTLAGSARILELHRLGLQMNGKPVGHPVLNELLVTHRKPAATSRYWLKIGVNEEVHRSSGVWISTAAGSTGAIRSAGAKPLPRDSKMMVYRPRELYLGRRGSYKLKGGTVPAGAQVQIGSLMREGLICLDGEHVTLPFPYGAQLQAKISGEPLRVVA
jgi:NAD+ kinase